MTGDRDVFVAKLNADGSGLVYSTLIGGNSADEAYGVALDQDDNACVVPQVSRSTVPIQ